MPNREVCAAAAMQAVATSSVAACYIKRYTVRPTLV